jgi:hypothetical protein
MAKQKTPQRLWEDDLLDAYYDYCWREVFDPLYDKMQLWKEGKLDHDAINRAVHETHKETQRLYMREISKRELLLVYARNTASFFQPWLAEHPAPEGVVLPE